MMNIQNCRPFSRLLKCSQVRSVCRGFSFTSRHHKVKISYAVYPEGSRLELAQQSPIFILHGLFGSKSNWHSLAKRINIETHRQVVTLDARNHGDSERSPKMDYLVMRDDLLGLMDLLKVERPILMGHSMGGKTVMACALSAPERVESLIVVDIAPEVSPSVNSLLPSIRKMKEITLPPFTTSLPQARRQVGEQLKEEVQEDSIRRFLLTNLKERSDSYTWSVNLDAILENFHSLMSFPEFSQPCSSVRTLFIGGANSQHLSTKAEPSVKKHFPAALIERVERAGHWVHSDKPKEFVRLVQHFVLSSTSPQQPTKDSS